MIHAALLMLAAPADLLEVGAGGFATIPAAITAASEGDTIRVASGFYGPFTVNGKALTIVANTSAIIQGTIRVQGLSLGQSVVIDGFNVLSPSDQPTESGIVVGVNRGSVRFQDVTSNGGTISSSSSTSQQRLALRIVDCDDVTFHASTFTGTTYCVNIPFSTYCEGAGAVSIFESNVEFHGCAATGASGFGDDFSNGGHAISASASSLYLQGCTLLGGSAGDFPFAQVGPRAGAGLSAYSTDVTVLDSTIRSGNANFPPPDIDLNTGSTLVQVDGDAVDHNLRTTAVEGSVIEFGATGGPLDTVILLHGSLATRRHLPAFFGNLLVTGLPGTFVRHPMGTGAAVSTTLTLPQVAPLQTTAWHLQTVHLRPSPGGTDVIFGPPHVLTILDSGL